MSYHDLDKGVRAHRLHAHLDGRGYSMHDLFRADMPVQNFHEGQINVSTIVPGVVKAFHWHRHQTDRWVCIEGNAKVVVVDFGVRDINAIQWMNVDTNGQHWFNVNGQKVFPKPSWKIHEFYIGEKNPQMIVIPPGMLHGYMALHDKPATILYHVTKKYDPDHPDEQRVAWDKYGADLWKIRNE